MTLNAIALIFILLAALYFLVLGIVSLAYPYRASSFLLGFASSAKLHYIELILRMLVGLAFLRVAPIAYSPNAFAIFGGILVATTAVMFLVPWRWHRTFAESAVPKALRYLKLIGIASIILALAIFYHVLLAIG